MVFFGLLLQDKLLVCKRNSTSSVFVKVGFINKPTLGALWVVILIDYGILLVCRK